MGGFFGTYLISDLNPTKLLIGELKRYLRRLTWAEGLINLISHVQYWDFPLISQISVQYLMAYNHSRVFSIYREQCNIAYFRATLHYMATIIVSLSNEVQELQVQLEGSGCCDLKPRLSLGSEFNEESENI